MGAHDDELIRDGRIAAAGERENIPHAAELLVVAAAVTGRFEPEFFEVADDVAAGGPAAAAAPLAAFEGVVGKRVDVPLGLFGLDARAGRGHQFGGEDGRRHRDESHLGDDGGQHQQSWKPRDPHDAWSLLA